MMKSQESVNYYNHHANRLDAEWVRSKNSGELTPFLAELEPNSRVLDLGCGTGIDLMQIQAAGHRGVGIDASLEMTELARARNPGAEILHKNYLLLSLKDAEFDGVWVNQSFAHLSPEEVQRVAAVCFKGLKPGGNLGLVIFEGVGTFEDREGDLSGPSRWIHLFTEKQICSMLEQTGYQISKVGRQAPIDSDCAGKLLILAKRIN